MKASVLVLDGEQRSALAVARSLGRRGIAVHVASHVARSLAGGSRFVASESLIPNPIDGAAAYAGAIARLAAERGVSAIFPMTEAATLALLEHRNLLGSVTVASAGLDSFRRATDKAAVLSIASRLGIDVPAQYCVADATEIESVDRERYPLVVKPGRSVVTGAGGRRKVSVQYARDRGELAQMLDRLGPEAGPFLLQARIHGPGVGIFLFRWKGDILATFAHRRIREKPPSGGVSVCCESIVAPPGLLQQSIQLLEALDWEGVAMVEYKQDRRTGRYYLMEINPRFWGSLQLAIDSGVDFPWYLHQAITGVALAPVAQWKVGRRVRWCWGEVDHLLIRLRHSPAALNLPADAPGLLSTVIQVLTPWRPRQKSDVFRWSDPVPGWRESVAWVRDLR